MAGRDQRQPQQLFPHLQVGPGEDDTKSQWQDSERVQHSRKTQERDQWLPLRCQQGRHHWPHKATGLRDRTTQHQRQCGVPQPDRDGHVGQNHGRKTVGRFGKTDPHGQDRHSGRAGWPHTVPQQCVVRLHHWHLFRCQRWPTVIKYRQPCST